MLAPWAPEQHHGHHCGHYQDPCPEAGQHRLRLLACFRHCRLIQVNEKANHVENNAN